MWRRISIRYRYNVLKTYPDIVRHDLPYIKRALEKWPNAIENNDQSTSNQAVQGFQPLSMGFIWISWVVAIEHGNLCIGNSVAQLYFLESVS